MTVELRQNTIRYQIRRREDRAVRARIKEISAVLIRYGQDRIYTQLKREGWSDNHKRVRRMYREEGAGLIFITGI